jgi:hypothetical protein
MYRYWSDGYRQDCSGFVSMAWNLPGNEWTGSLDQYGVRIAREELQPGDILLFHNPADPEKGSHVVIFGGWTDYTQSYYVAYESTRPHARRLVTPYAYWSHSDRYLAYRYKGLTGGATGTKPDAGGPDDERPGTDPPGTGQPVAAEPEDPQRAAPYPGRAYFGPGAHNKHVTQLGRMLMERGPGSPSASEPRQPCASWKARVALRSASVQRGPGPWA